ncbi:MAG: hypothetical protein IIA68_10940 [Proteobacteria bacterium]|nr:hypothetical protein [Pseudomonadota bacterium]
MTGSPKTRTARDAGRRVGGAQRSAARLAAVQALYQVEMTGASAESVLAEFLAHRLDEEVDGLCLAAADRRFLDELDLGLFLEIIDVSRDQLDFRDAIRVIEDYKPLDVQSALMALALCRGIRERYPDWKFLTDGDGGDAIAFEDDAGKNILYRHIYRINTNNRGLKKIDGSAKLADNFRPHWGP